MCPAVWELELDVVRMPHNVLPAEHRFGKRMIGGIGMALVTARRGPPLGASMYLVLRVPIQ